ncbi:MAG: hypothetical protein KAG20_04575 [Cocleimonas sp.]|nr:hypothetical protein [Cocleimonas sp.]
MKREIISLSLSVSLCKPHIIRPKIPICLSLLFPAPVPHPHQQEQAATGKDKGLLLNSAESLRIFP